MPFKSAGLAWFCANEKCGNIVNDDRVKHSAAKWVILITFFLSMHIKTNLLSITE
jgi:hypothetical protein